MPFQPMWADQDERPRPGEFEHPALHPAHAESRPPCPMERHDERRRELSPVGRRERRASPFDGRPHPEGGLAPSRRKTACRSHPGEMPVGRDPGVRRGVPQPSDGWEPWVKPSVSCWRRRVLGFIARCGGPRCPALDIQARWESGCGPRWGREILGRSAVAVSVEADRRGAQPGCHAWGWRRSARDFRLAADGTYCGACSSTWASAVNLRPFFDGARGAMAPCSL